MYVYVVLFYPCHACDFQSLLYVDPTNVLLVLLKLMHSVYPSVVSMCHRGICFQLNGEKGNTRRKGSESTFDRVGGCLDWLTVCADTLIGLQCGWMP